MMRAPVLHNLCDISKDPQTITILDNSAEYTRMIESCPAVVSILETRNAKGQFQPVFCQNNDFHLKSCLENDKLVLTLSKASDDHFTRQSASASSPPVTLSQ